jgi:hypothetical protein
MKMTMKMKKKKKTPRPEHVDEVQFSEDHGLNLTRARRDGLIRL